MFFRGNEYLTSSNNEIVPLCLNCVDLKLFFEHYDVYNLEYLSGWKFKATRGLFTGYIDSNTLIHSLRAPAAVIYRSSEGPAHIDGEPMILEDIMDVKCHHHGLNIFIPGDKQPFRPLVTPVKSMWRNIFSFSNK